MEELNGLKELNGLIGGGDRMAEIKEGAEIKEVEIIGIMDNSINLEITYQDGNCQSYVLPEIDQFRIEQTEGKTKIFIGSGNVRWK